jgi:hypothetical protein
VPDRDRDPAARPPGSTVDDRRAVGGRRHHGRTLDAIVSVDRAIHRPARADRVRPRPQFDAVQPLAHSRAGDRRLISSVGAMACFVVSAASYVPFIGVALWILPRWTQAHPPSWF